jgi:xylulose-5-phosphate/fructose-6-phosphate phosphoketolase
MGANPHANGGILLRDLRLPDFRDYAVAVPTPGSTVAEATRAMGVFLRDVMQKNPDNFACSARTKPPPTASVRFRSDQPLLDGRASGRRRPSGAPDGRVMEMLSEHACQGWLEGYLLTGRHGLFSCYEAFIHIVDSMFNQHAKWLKVCGEFRGGGRLPRSTILLTSHVWRQDHNGFSHQDPGFIDHVINKKADIIRVYLPPDANTLLYVTDHCLKSRNLVNVIVAGKQPARNGWTWRRRSTMPAPASASGNGPATTRGEPDIVLACSRRCADAGNAGGHRHPARADPA